MKNNNKIKIESFVSQELYLKLKSFEKNNEITKAEIIRKALAFWLSYVDNFFPLIEKVNKELNNINKILNSSSNNLQNFATDLFNIAKNTKQPFKLVKITAQEFAKQGLGLEETLKRTRDALILTRLSGLDTVSSVKVLTAAINSFSDSVLTSTEIINKLANVDAAFAVSSRDLAESIRRVGSSAQDVGVDIDKLIALVTSAQQTTARGGAVIGNALKTIFTRIQRTDVLDQLEVLGIKTKDLNNKNLPAIELIKSIALSYDKLTLQQQSQLSELISGIYQKNILKTIINNIFKKDSIYNKIINMLQKK